MNYIGIEKEAVEMVLSKVKGLSDQLNTDYPINLGIENEWIESHKLTQILGITQRTLQSYRTRGIIGSSTIGRKIYYRTKDIEVLLTKKV